MKVVRGPFAILALTLIFGSFARGADYESSADAPTAPVQEFHRGDTLIVTGSAAAVYSDASESSRTTTVVGKGRRVRASGPAVDGFVPLATKSGKAWVRSDDVRDESAKKVEIIDADSAPDRNPRKSATSYPFGIERLTFDLGGSVGSTNGFSYTEINLGLNAYFSEYLAWRNALFARFGSGVSTTTGLDSSLRGIYNVSGRSLGVTVFAGPGWRFAFQGQGAPLAEAGAVFHLAGLSVGGGVKSIMNSWVTSSTPNDVQYFLILAGGGSL